VSMVLRRGGGEDIGCHDWSLLSKHRPGHLMVFALRIGGYYHQASLPEDDDS
jgi:hypothetical protein